MTMVKTGYNTDYGKYKFDVGLGEEDIARLLAENGLPPDAELTVMEAHDLLRLTAEMFVVADKIRTDPQYAERHKVAGRSLSEQRAGLISKIAARMGQEPDEKK